MNAWREGKWVAERGLEAGRVSGQRGDALVGATSAEGEVRAAERASAVGRGPRW